MRAITIKQPWAWAIVAGYKPVENRPWRTAYRGPIAIHAGKSIDRAAYARLVWLGYPVPEDLPRGGIVAHAELVDCVSKHPSPWFAGPWGFVLDRVEPVTFQPMRGQLGLFRVAA